MAVAIREYIEQPPTFHDYDPQASAVGQALICAIASTDRRLRIEHVGSSSVKGCGGKGYIDLLVLYPAGQLDVAKQALAALGFQRQQSRWALDQFLERDRCRLAVLLHGARTWWRKSGLV